MSVPSSQISPRAYKVTLTAQEQQDLHFLLGTVATKSKMWLGFNVSKLSVCKDRLEHLHPLTFLQSAFSDPTLKAHLPGLKAHGKIVMGPFIKGLQEGLDREHKLGNLTQHVESFAKQIQLPVHTVSEAVESNTLGKFLFEQCVH